MLIYLCHKATEPLDSRSRLIAFSILGSFMFVSKFIKLVGHYIRYPVDFLLLPLSILFGYFHGFVKLYAMLTLNVVSDNALLAELTPEHTKRSCTNRMVKTAWGSRQGADTADATRMVRVTTSERHDEVNHINPTTDWYTQ